MDKTNVLVIGCGSIGIRHLQNLLLRSDVNPGALDPFPGAEERVAELSPSIRFFNQPAGAGAWKPELVIVATPNHLHQENCLWAFDLGADVLCEKPLADSLEGGTKIVAAAKARNRRLAVGFSERYRQAIQFMEEEVRAGHLGTLVGGRAMVGTYFTLMCAKNPKDRCETFGNVIIDYVHELDILASLFGDFKRVECMSNRLGDKPLRANPGLAEILVEYESGAVVSVHMDYVQHPSRRIFEIYGDRKTFSYNFMTDTLEIYDAEKPDGIEVRRFNYVRNELFQREHEDALNMRRTGSRPRVTGEDALRSLALAETAIRKLRDEKGS
jgi:predicted dehydrogenase